MCIRDRSSCFDLKILRYKKVDKDADSEAAVDVRSYAARLPFALLSSEFVRIDKAATRNRKAGFDDASVHTNAVVLALYVFPPFFLNALVDRDARRVRDVEELAPRRAVSTCIKRVLEEFPIREAGILPQ